MDESCVSGSQPVPTAADFVKSQEHFDLNLEMQSKDKSFNVDLGFQLDLGNATRSGKAAFTMKSHEDLTLYYYETRSCYAACNTMLNYLICKIRATAATGIP